MFTLLLFSTYTITSPGTVPQDRFSVPCFPSVRVGWEQPRLHHEEEFPGVTHTCRPSPPASVAGAPEMRELGACLTSTAVSANYAFSPSSSGIPQHTPWGAESQRTPHQPVKAGTTGTLGPCQEEQKLVHILRGHQCLRKQNMGHPDDPTTSKGRRSHALLRWAVPGDTSARPASWR